METDARSGSGEDVARRRQEAALGTREEKHTRNLKLAPPQDVW